MAEINSNSRLAPSELLAGSMEKPQLDNRTYRVVKLPNQLEALLIHDADTDKASAAMDVNVGSFSDAADMPGMAHAVEHLLFMGTKKFPVENEYNQYLTRYGGHSNAFTASCDTNYYFELSASAAATNSQTSSLSSKESLAIPKSQAPLYGGLDRFAQFFVQPLFLEDTLDRELRAVDSENKKNLQSDNWRLNQLSRSLANKDHPYNRFATGNYKVLHDDPIERGVAIRKEFIDFYKKHYSANRMKLAVLGRESLDEMEQWVRELFADVPDQDLPKLRWDGIPAFSQDEVRTQVFAKPVMDSRMLSLDFLYPDEEHLWESHPAKYLGHLVGHEGPGSILAYIKAKGWANALGAGNSGICPGTALFSLQIRLTEDGLKNYKEVVKVVLQYVAMVKEQPPQQWIFDEIKQLAEVDFRFQEKAPASRTVSALSGIMQNPWPRQNLLSAQTLMRKFDPEAIQNGLDHLTPDNLRITVVAQDFPGDWNQKEKWYGTEYKYEKIPDDFFRELKSAHTAAAGQRPAELHMPGKNAFVPTRLDVEKKEVEQPAVTPKLIRNDANVRTWWKKDDQFWAPKANLNIVFRSAVVNVSALTAVLTQLYKELIEDSLVEYAYDAELAGLEYDVQNHAQGIDLSINGYNDKMHVLLEKVLLSMRDLQVKDDRFEIVKDRLLRGWRNFDYQQPYSQVSHYSRWLFSERGCNTQQLLDELPAITADDVRTFFPQILRQMHIEVLAHGNLYREDALKLTNIVESVMKPKLLPASQWPIRRSLVLPAGSNYVYKRTLKDPANVNHCIDYMLFTGLHSNRATRVKLLLFAHMADEPCFDTLRTKEQLGYIVSSSASMLTAVSAFRILIQSEKTPEYLEKRIEVFLTAFGETLRHMSEEDFEAHKIALINKRLVKLKTLGQETGRFWHHITSESFDYELVYRDVEHVEPMTKQDMLDFFDFHLNPESPDRAKAAVHLLAQANPAEVEAKKAEQQTKVAGALSQHLGQTGHVTNVSQLAKRLAAVDITGGDTNALNSAISSHLTEDEGLSSEEAKNRSAAVNELTGQLLPAMGIQVKSGEAKPDTASVTSSEARLPAIKEASVIEDVRLFKAGIPVSEGIKPVKDLSEFEDLEPKL